MSSHDTSAIDALWSRYGRTRSEEDRNRLVVHYAPLVKYVGGRLASTLPRHVEVDDLLSDGTLGLVGAVERFDPALSVEFAGFAISRIRGAMVDGLRVMDWLPRQVRAQVKELETCTQRLYAEIGRPPTEQELSYALEITPDEVRDRRQHRANSRQTSLPEGEEVDAYALAPHGDSGASPAQLPPALVRALRAMTERDQVLIALYYYERLTMAEIGAVLGVSESRVSQMHHRIRRELRERVRPSLPEVAEDHAAAVG